MKTPPGTFKLTRSRINEKGGISVDGRKYVRSFLTRPGASVNDPSLGYGSNTHGDSQCLVQPRTNWRLFLSLQSLQIVRGVHVPLVRAASFLTFVGFLDFFKSRCFGFPIVDLFSLVKLPVIFDQVRTTGPIRSRSLQVLLFSSSGPPCGGNWGVFGDVSEAQI